MEELTIPQEFIITEGGLTWDVYRKMLVFIYTQAQKITQLRDITEGKHEKKKGRPRKYNWDEPGPLNKNAYSKFYMRAHREKLKGQRGGIELVIRE